jgi:hypothetical protein
MGSPKPVEGTGSRVQHLQNHKQYFEHDKTEGNLLTLLACLSISKITCFTLA